MKLRLTSLLIAGLALASTSAQANHHYGMAGCGLGAVALGADGNQILVGTTNNLLFPQTFAITSGTSNCTDSAQTASLFITLNQEALRNDIARGNGEALVGLSEVLNCSDADMLGNVLKQNYGKIFPASTTSAEEVSRSISSTIQSDAELAQSCAVVG